MDKGPGEILGKALKELESMTEGTWKEQRDAVAVLVQQVKEWVDGRVLREGRQGGTVATA